VRVGDLNRRVWLQYQTRAADGMGGATVTWTDKAEVWAAIWPTSATMQIKAGQPANEISHRIRMRYRPDLRANWRIRYGDRYFTVLGVVNPNERGTMLDLLVKEAAPA
jgi:SPP1 family predicted phage head-tail adaptor